MPLSLLDDFFTYYRKNFSNNENGKQKFIFSESQIHLNILSCFIHKFSS
jgi:hypothetical protein